MKALLLFGLLAVAACDPLLSARTVVVPRPAYADSTARGAGPSALAMIARIAARHGLRPSEDQPRWAPCYSSGSLKMCSRMTADTLEVAYSEILQLPAADRLRREITDSLQALVGPEFVRECRWRMGQVRAARCVDVPASTGRT
jgi:hypothetical protein